ncbi:MAG TPA: vitamin B12-dependent ribonucleotide reductase [Bacteroidia bacterium]|nr:vitamin B12-dependent ribonucleotide reductase [Sphingobacteriales bacterium]HPD66150.1 vitamin B12-dependent ribonucleotide reductase [Bacteroidia bacterium]HRS59799.1 vitamin B12-dependent ribonucleotide reductase [Bacteroidia bacterium]HRU68517.1 vitamin B12-dependent ribonucleotide reductase [Bacteroidia bacterium]
MKKDYSKKEGLEIKRFYTKKGISPYDQFTYELRHSLIKNSEGETVFEMKNVEVPAGWSQVATDILAQKYFRKAGVPRPDGTTGRETSIKEVVHRMANDWKCWGEEYGYFNSAEDAQAFYDEIVYMLLAQIASPNSPQWFNTGLYRSYGIKGHAQGHYYVDPFDGEVKKSESAYERPQPHACFILSVDDDLVNKGGIMDLWVREARIFKYGSGVGTNYSNLRSKYEKLSGGGQSSGLMSFLQVGDRAAGAIKSGGTTRRAAKMVILDVDHPEIEEFINWKVEEEKKVKALIEAGYSADYEGEAYRTISGQNSNNSVRVTNEFIRAVEEDRDWELTERTTGRVIKKIKARQLWQQIVEAAWNCADPGLQFDTTINDWHTCPEGGRIRASNPCSEYMFLDNTACNLASLNLRKFYNEETGIFDVEAYKYAIRLWTIVLEISVLMAQFPSEEVARLSYDYRTLGLGYANLGSLLMVSGIPYDSEEAFAMTGALTSILTGHAYTTSAEMAKILGPFKEYEKNKPHFLRVIKNHRLAANNLTEGYEGLEVIPKGIEPRYCPDYLLKAACQVWDDALKMGEEYGFRNAQVTVLAPTGTIGLVMDCDTTGIEPDFTLVKFKKLAGGGNLKIINQSIPVALKRLGYSEKEIDDIVKYTIGTGSFKDAPYINYGSLLNAGLAYEDIKEMEAKLKGSYSLHDAVSVRTLGVNFIEKLGIPKEKYERKDFHLLKELGFTDKEIAAASLFVCGNLSIEGAPHLKEEHLPIFDTANKNGYNGKRFIHPMGHIRQMAAAQPFITGAISKTVNFPNETTIEEIDKCYYQSWKLGLKSISIYRDGSKYSQPLTSTSDDKKTDSSSKEGERLYSIDELTQEQVLQAAQKLIAQTEDTKFKRELSRIVEKKRLPSKRKGFTQKAKIGGQTIFVRTGEYSDGTLGEVFIDMHKEGASFRSMLNSFAIAISIGLQYGVPLEEYVEKFTFTRFDPSGNVDHPNIKYATSIIDYVFRLLGFEYLNRTDLVQVPPEALEQIQNPTISLSNETQQSIESHEHEHIQKPVLTSTPNTKDAKAYKPQEGYLSNMMGDAPPCDLCGHITVRNGTCYKCLNCGNSLGCS